MHPFAILVVAVVACNAQTIPPPIPGVAGSSNSAGIGSGVDASKLGVYGLDINPMAPVIEMQWCPDECYTPAHQYDPDCEYCQFALPSYENMTYRVPSNVFLDPETASGGCFEQQTSAHVEDYEQMVGHAAGGGGWFSSWSKVTENFYGMYYKTDSSLSLETKNLIWYSLRLYPESIIKPKPTFDFTQTMLLLPKTYNYTVYKENVIDQFGTHYLSAAHIGGAAVMTAYFHSCFLEQFSGQYVFQQSSSSFFGLFNHGSKNDHGYNHTSSEFKQWSQIKVELVGGDADRYATLNWTHFMTADQAQQWEDTIKFNMLPLTYSLEPLYTLVDDPVIAANINQSFVDYGVAIKSYNVGVVKNLVPQDPYVKPPWCKFNPHPPLSSTAAFTVDNVGESGLPACPSLPSESRVAAAVHARR